MSVSFTAVMLWVLRVLASLIMLQTLFYKFSGAEESVYIFSQLGMEPWGRIGIGIFEFIAALLILYPRTTWLGALLGAGLMSGALFFHLTKLGIVVRNDGGQLFIYAAIAFCCCIGLLVYYRALIVSLFRNLFLDRGI